MKIKGTAAELREFFYVFCHKPKTKARLLIVTFDPDELIPKKKMKLTRPIKPGYRRPFTITPDEPVDVNETGTFFKSQIVAGDSTVTLDPASTPTSLKGWINGDGATGEKSVRFVADGHLGAGEQEVSIDVEFSVATPDATLLSFTEGTDELIPPV